MSDKPTTYYRKPPIKERVITAFLSEPISKQVFAEKAETFKAVVERKFPVFDPRIGWNLNIIDKGGVPVIADSGPTMEIHHWFRDTALKTNKGLILQSHPDRFSINLMGNPQAPGRFEEAYSAFSEWLPIWANHFGAISFRGVALDYVNALSKSTVAEFYTGEKLQISEVMSCFGGIPIPGSLVPPYDFQMNFKVDEQYPVYVRILTKSERDKTLRVELKVSTTKKGKTIGLDGLNSEVLVSHDWMIKSFEAVFTDNARNTFDPVTE